MGLISAVKNSLHQDSNATAGDQSSHTEHHEVRQAGATAGAEKYTSQSAPVVHETIKQRSHEEVQPIIERERDETHVHQVVQPITDNRHEVHHAQSRNQVIASETVEDVNESDARRYQQNRSMQSTQHVETADRTHSTNAPIVNEKVHRHDIVEVQPVIQREIQKEEIIHTEQPMYQKIVGAPKVHETVVNAPMSVEEFERSGGSLQGSNLHRA